ncbi:MAG: hypothetical protein HQL72_01210 [Magnetococcales bacterium]|nr:hypothetical protein [Magnetococcales bacterium]
MAKKDKKDSKKNKKSNMSKRERIALLEKKIKIIEKTMFEQTTQLSERSAALLRKVTEG